jgi:hypothetical protein
LSRTVSLRYRAEIQRTMFFFQRRRRALFEALASSNGGTDWGVMIIKKVEDSSHPHESLISGVAPHAFPPCSLDVSQKSLDAPRAAARGVVPLLRTPRALPTTRRLCLNGSTTAGADEVSALQAKYTELLRLVQSLSVVKNVTSNPKTDASPKTPSPVGRVGEVEEGKEEKGAKVLQLDEASGVFKGRRLFPPTDGSRSVIVAPPSQPRESAAFAESVQATGLTILELRRDPHLLWLAIRQRGALQRFDVDALFYRLQRVTMQAGENLRDVADRIEKLASQYELYAATPIDDRRRRLILTNAVNGNPLLRDALDQHEALHDFCETDKSFAELVEYLEAVESKHRRRADLKRADAPPPKIAAGAVVQQQPQRGAQQPPPSGAQQQQPRAKQQQQRLQQQPRLCTVCVKRGHTRENCYAASKMADKGDTRASPPRCFSCAEEGHISRYCPQKQKPAVKFAAASRARKSSKKPAVVSDDEDYWTAADTERVRHGAAAHAVADSLENFACMARSARAQSDIGMRPVYLDNAANIAVTGDMSVFDGPLMAASPVWVNTAEKGGGKTFVDKAAPAFGFDLVYYNPGCPMTLLPYYELLDRYPLNAFRVTKTSTSWDNTPYFFERTSYNMFKLANANAVRSAFALKQNVVQHSHEIYGPVVKILFDAPSLTTAATVTSSVDEMAATAPDVASAKLWRLHRAFGHISITRLKELLRSGAITVPGISYDVEECTNNAHTNNTTTQRVKGK